MPFRSSAIVPHWVAKSTSPRYSPRPTPSSAASTNNSRGEKSNDLLVIEDLDLADLDISLSTVRSRSPITDEASQEECFLYPDVDVNSIFGDQIPHVVSEACLRNDLYILVKVPTNTKNHASTSNTATQTTPKSSRSSPNLCVNSNHRIFPIQEEEEDHSVQEHKSKTPIQMKPKGKKPCWVIDNNTHEEFVSTTNIIHCHDTIPLPNQVPEQPEGTLLEVAHHNESCLPSCQNQIELQEVNLNSARFHGRANVTLENYGILITPTKAPTTENLLVFQVDTESKEIRAAKRHSCFEWLRKFFFHRNRNRNGFVHAKVYKTYFVKWRHCSDSSDGSKCRCRASKLVRRNSA